jgi:hypothetical protein
MPNQTTEVEQPKKKGLFWKILKVAGVLLIALSVKGKIRGEVGNIAKDLDPDILKEL